jgi:hypothetical protein
MRGRSREGGGKETQREELFFSMRDADESSPSTADVSNGIIFPHGVIANLMRERANRERSRERERETQRQRQRETERERDRERETETERQRDREDEEEMGREITPQNESETQWCNQQNGSAPHPSEGVRDSIFVPRYTQRE